MTLDDAEALVERAGRRGLREINSVANALRLVEALAHRDDASISELATELGLSKPSVDRLLVTLLAGGFAEQEPLTKRYRLSTKILGLADGVRSRTTVIAVARPLLVALAERIGETINLGTLTGAAVTYVDTIHSRDIFRIETRPGTTLPVHCTALGKAILAHRPSAEVEALLPTLVLERFTTNTIISLDTLRAALVRARADGYAVDDAEISEDVHCVAVPILDRGGHAVAGLSVTVPQPRFAQALPALVAELRLTAGHVGARIT